MKKNWIIGSIAAVLVAVLLIGNIGLNNEVSADIDTSVNVVTVNGVGAITVKPDIAYINVGVETQNADAAIAQDENSEKMNKVMAALKNIGILEDDIKTVQYSVYDRQDYFDGGKGDKYYQVTNIVKVTVKDIEKVGEVIDVVSTAGANQVSSIQFGISNEDEVYQEALKLAMTSAKGKANSLLSTFGKSADEPSKISETSYFSGVVRAEYEMVAMDAKMSTPVSSGELTVTANVTVEYNY